MAKEGLDFVPLDCRLDEKFELIEAEFGIKGFAVIVKLFQRIYGGHGYYCEWNEDIAFLFAKQNSLSSNGASNNLIHEIVSASIRRGIFDKEVFEKYGILTSKGIQKRYLEATARRKNVNLEKQYLLLSADIFGENVNILSGNVDILDENVDISKQVKGSKGSKENKKTLCKADASALFESLWKKYPTKKGKGQVSDAAKKRLLDVGEEEMLRAIDRYIMEWEKDKDWRKPQNGSTFFNSGYVDYLDANYVPSTNKPQKQPGTKFNNFKQRDYDFNELAKQLINK